MSQPTEYGAADLLRFKAQGLRKQAEQDMEDMCEEGHRVLDGLRKEAGEAGAVAANAFLQKTAGVSVALPYGSDLAEIRDSMVSLVSAPPVLQKQAAFVVAAASPTEQPVANDDLELVKAAEEDVCRRLLTGALDRETAQAALAQLRLMRGAA